MMKILVTGAAGFIGARLCDLLLERGDEIVGVDNLNDYYDVSLKRRASRCWKAVPDSNFASSTSRIGARWLTCSHQRGRSG